MEASENVANGFFLALHLLDSLGAQYDRSAVMQRLVEVAKGEVSVFNSPEEEFDTLVRERVTPVAPGEKEAFVRGFINRGDMDMSHRQSANHVVRVVLRDHGGQWPG